MNLGNAFNSAARGANPALTNSRMMKSSSKTPVTKRKYTAVTQSKYLTKKAAAQMIQRAFRQKVEHKSYFNSANEDTVSTLSQGASTNWYRLLAPGTGTGGQGRIGNEIIADSVEILGHLNNNGTVVNYVRLVVGWLVGDVSGTADSSTDIFQSGTVSASDFGTITGLQAMYAPINNNKLLVLSDTVHRLAKSSAVEGNDTKMFKIKRSLRQTKVIFEAQGSQTITNMNKQLYLIAFAAEAPNDTTTGTVVELSFISKAWYIDP